ncbi:MAG: carboxypeptidase-like regulatory domain-containing protein [Pedobacter sp.]|uniref:carboxypeptidase-like regulatory domain-containing protein n=1 Tax=Pedobacter sp. TaxID=1411316 RepID=UPI0028086125|nr:carboxypeptidase-like regulatory domain-containing protein [Pedobacter sp.]MDQ8005080.1 carboxypeptidase-like regulatory domain-containing protein [Pedobacter sp.]
MKNLNIIYLLFLVGLSFKAKSQIKIVDSLTKQPIVGATISIIDESPIKITDQYGNFDFQDLGLDDNRWIAISSLGYSKLVLQVKKAKISDTLRLKPAIYQLNEVSISTKKYSKHLVGGGMTLLHGDNHWGGYGYEEARFFPNDYKKDSKILAVQYFVVTKQPFQKKTKVDLNNAFGVGIYEANADGSPGKPLLTEEILVKAEKHAKWVTVNLEQYNLPMPKYGFVVGFKIFPASFYGEKNGFVKVEDFVAPLLAIKTYIKKSEDSWHRSLFKHHKWTKETHSHFGIRAMVAEAK